MDSTLRHVTGPYDQVFAIITGKSGKKVAKKLLFYFWSCRKVAEFGKSCRIVAFFKSI